MDFQNTTLLLALIYILYSRDALFTKQVVPLWLVADCGAEFADSLSAVVTGTDTLVTHPLGARRTIAGSFAHGGTFSTANATVEYLLHFLLVLGQTRLRINYM